MTQLLTQVTNTLTTAATSFSNYPFNSMVKFNGVYLGASSSGLYELDDSGSTEAVVGVLSTGDMSFGTDLQKRMESFYLSMRSEGDITLRVTLENGDPYEYTVQSYGVETLQQRRSLLGKGMKSKYWRFELECADPFDYDAMTAGVVVLSRRL